MVIFGLGKLAELAHFYLTHDSEMEVAGFVVDDDYFKTNTFFVLPVVSSSQVSLDFPSEKFSMFVAMGYTHGDNCLILEDNSVQPFVTMGKNVFLWSGNHIGHHSVLEDDVYVSSHCVVSGNCRIGRGSFLGVNCTIQDNVAVGSECFVGPQSLVRHDLSPGTVLISTSTPAQKVSSRNLRL